ncbi:MAG: hypothetical protein V1894_03525 [Chloroflexota bacterium]
MLLIDGVKYEEWTPENEDQLEQMVNEHAQEIFGENSAYFDRKLRLRGLSGIGSIPDGYAVIFGNSPEWHIVEVELSSHQLYDHIVPQVGRFVAGVANPATRNQIVSAIYGGINGDDLLKIRAKKALGSEEVYKFLSELVSKPPQITIVIEKKTPELDDALNAINHPEKKVVELRTFRRVEADTVHAHLFEPIHKDVLSVIAVPPEASKPAIVNQNADKVGQQAIGDTLEITIRNPSFIKFHLFYIPKGKRSFFPGYKITFTVETDIGTIESCVSSAKAGTPVGDPNAGYFIQRNLAEWYRKHKEIKIGDKVKITVIEPFKKYRLEIVK